MNVNVLCSRCLRYIKPKFADQPYCRCDFEGAPMMTTDEPVADTGGTKHDTGKPQLSLIPRTALDAEARVFGYGAKKYSRFNFKKGFKYSRLIDAALRHILAFNDGENLDPETNESHLAHARCCLAMLIDTIALGTSTDDRFTKGS